MIQRTTKGAAMKFKAIIFDLFGTLVDNFSKKEHDKVHALMAETLSMPYKAFRQAFGSSFSDRCMGGVDYQLLKLRNCLNYSHANPADILRDE